MKVEVGKQKGVCATQDKNSYFFLVGHSDPTFIYLLRNKTLYPFLSYVPIKHKLLKTSGEQLRTFMD